jgi:hypothetical protein
MRRRALLASAAVGVAGVAGCAGLSAMEQPDDDAAGNGSDGGGSGDGPSGDDPAGDDDPDGDGPFDDATSVVELETGPRTLAFSGTGRYTDDGARVQLAFDRTATADHPARLTGTLRNENDYANTFELEWIPAVGRIHSSTLSDVEGYPSLHLAPTKHNDLATTVPDLERTSEGYWQVAELGPWIEERRRLEPGESVDLEYVVASDPDTTGRPTGTYEFRGDDGASRVTVWNTDVPGPSDESRFAGRSVPPIDEETTIQWHHEADESTPTYLQPRRERVALDAAIDFELVNNSHESVGCGHWNLHKLVDGEWFHVGPLVHTADCRSILSGARMDWTLRAFNGPAVRCDCGYSCGDGLTRGYLGGGTYAVVAGYGSPADESGALVELVGDPVTLEPTDGVTIERDGTEVVVTTPAFGDGEHPEDATLTVERAGDDADGDADRLIVEELMGGRRTSGRSRALRNAIAVFEEDVERVDVRTDEYAVDDAVGHDASTRVIRVRGEPYELTAERPGE